MKKKLLALAVAGAFVAPVAMADTTIYGVANMSYDMTNTGTTSGSESQTKVSSNSSRLGFKGTEDLGGGTNAIYQIETQVFMDGDTTSTTASTVTANTLGTRNTFVGLSGESWGTILLGRNDTPYKASTRRLDLFADGIADNRSLMGGIIGKSAVVGFDGRNANVVQYNSPNLSGFTASAQYTAGAEAATTSGMVKGNALSLAGMYDAGPIFVTLAYQTNKFGTSGSGTLAGATTTQVDHSERAWKVGGSYTMDQFQVNAVYESTKDDTGTAGADVNGHKAYYLGGKFNVSSSDAVKLAYTKAKEIQSGNTVNSGAKQVSLGYDHAMSKRTTVYALYTKLSNDSAMNYALSSASAVSTGALAAQGNDSDPHAFSLGIKHTF